MLTFTLQSKANTQLTPVKVTRRLPDETDEARSLRFLEHVQELVKAEDTPPNTKAHAHYLMACAIDRSLVKKDDVLGEVKAHLDAAEEERKKAKAVFVSEKMDEFLSCLGDEIEKGRAEFGRPEQELNAGGTEESAESDSATRASSRPQKDPGVQ